MTTEELKRRIEIADRVLRETRQRYWHTADYLWLVSERARLVCEPRSVQTQEQRT